MHGFYTEGTFLNAQNEIKMHVETMIESVEETSNQQSNKQGYIVHIKSHFGLMLKLIYNRD